jgi:hypothetical protein
MSCDPDGVREQCFVLGVGSGCWVIDYQLRPVEVTDELFAQIKEHFNDKQLVEITALLTAVNLDRFNAAFAIGSAGFSEGMVCVPADRANASLPQRAAERSDRRSLRASRSMGAGG